VFDVALGPASHDLARPDSSFRKLLRATAESASEVLRGFPFSTVTGDSAPLEPVLSSKPKG
jgi:hypothetical protein